MQSFYGALANVILILHVGYVLFVVGGLILILAGGVRGWQWEIGRASCRERV